MKGVFEESCFETMSRMEDKSVDIIITDPVWPGTSLDIPGADRPYELFAEAAAKFPRITNSLIVHLGCDSDPRFLSAVPKELPFVRVCWLEYIRPHYKGRILYTSDVAYVFGEPRVPEGKHLLPGRFLTSNKARLKYDHPCPRAVQHVRWLVSGFTREGDFIYDPFGGSGVTAVAAESLNRRWAISEISHRYADAARSRIRQFRQQKRFDFEEDLLGTTTITIEEDEG